MRLWMVGVAAMLAPLAYADERVVIRVMFAPGSAVLDAAGEKTVAEAAVRAKACEHNGVRVIGHTDTSLANAESDALGKARGKVVRDALVAKGVAGSAISAVGHGENALAVATADGVRETRNERVEIVLVCD